MFGFRKGAAPAEKPPRQTSNDPDDSDDEDSSSAPKNMGRRTASEPNLDSMSVQELEGYAVNQAEQTTRSVNNCLKIAEDIRGDASRTLETLHAQGDQIHRTHVMAADMEKDLSKGEKLLNSLGGMFSMPWKPKKGKAISGPATSKDDNDIPKRATKEQRQKLGVDRKARGSRAPDGEPTSALQKVDMEKDKQDDGLSDLSDILGDLKGMAVEMGSELDKQNKALDSLDEDVDELNSRVKGANTRARKLLN
ncbi:putative SNAP25 homologous protein SNAP30 [Salvia splendens]|uniref:putative SNAP25 homologous protein SNAP30 n=1 Tax=Salvia splendens TaxID=180675 RepID=UPI001C26EA3A|nr:putative SNAP25 homologous protein SNAP30 [Salvia splendens]XP_042052812.1 putative SNAP25 homologous protein SNAP30 [Salvia splendens]